MAAATITRAAMAAQAQGRSAQAARMLRGLERRMQGRAAFVAAEMAYELERLVA